jgi:hypothetical protein
MALLDYAGEAELNQFGTLAQLVEQRTFNPFVVGSTPARPTNFPAWGLESLLSNQ